MQDTQINGVNGDKVLSDEIVDFKKILSRFIDHWRLFIISIVLIFALAFLYLRYSTPMYKVNATLLVQDDQKGSDLFGSASSAVSDFSSLFGTKSNVDNEVQVLQTADLMGKVIRDLRLYVNYYRLGSFQDIELYKTSPFEVTFLNQIDSLRGDGLQLQLGEIKKGLLHIKEKAQKRDSSYVIALGKPFRTMGGNVITINETGIPVTEKEEYRIGISPIHNLENSLSRSVVVDVPNKQVSVITLQLKSSSTVKGTEILQTLINEYMQGNMQQKNAFADSTISFINGRILIVNKELSSIESGVQSFEQENNIADIKEQANQTIIRSSDYTQQLNQAEVQQQITEEMLDYLKDEHNNTRPVPSLMSNADPTFFALLEKYNALQVQLDRLNMGSTENNPIVKNLQEQIRNIRTDMKTSLENQLKAINIGLDRLRKQNGVLDAFIKNVPLKQRQFIDLSREQDIKQALFVYLLQKKEEVAVTKASNISSAIMIDSPKADDQPYSPKRNIILALAFLAALGLPYALLMLMEILNNKVQSSGDITSEGISLLGEIGHNATHFELIFREKSRSIIAEQFRAIRTNLQFVLGEKKCPIILMTSSMSGEGKSFIAVNLAQAYVANGKKVLLMELDLRRPKLAKNLGIQSATGFSNYIISPTSIKEITTMANADGTLHIITAGPTPPNPAELLSNEKTRELIHQLKDIYDLIIIDTAPIGLVADAQLLAPYADCVLYVVRQDFTFKQQTGIIKDLVTNKKMSNIYAILNDVKLKASHRYGYGYGYGNGYGYGYGYGYGIEEKKKTWFRAFSKN